MLISHLDERRTKTKTKGELLKRKNFVTLIHPATNTNKKQSKRNCSSTKPAQESNLNGMVISSKRSSPVSRELPNSYTIFFFLIKNRQSPIGDKFASAKTKKQNPPKKKKRELKMNKLSINQHQHCSNLHWNKFTVYVQLIRLHFTKCHLQSTLLCFLQFRHLFSSSFNNLLRVVLQDFYFGLTTEAERRS